MRRFLAFLPIVGIVALLIGCSKEKSSTAVTPLEEPSNLRVTLSSSSVAALVWADNSDNEEGFKIKRSVAGQNTWTNFASVGANVSTYTDTGLVEATSYSYTVLAFKGTELSTTTDTAAVTTVLFGPQDLGAVELSSTSIALSWRDRSSVETGYRVERKLGTGAFTLAVLLPANTTALLDTQLTANSSYTYRIAAVKDAMVSEWSNESSARTRFQTPNAPSGLAIETLGTSSLRLTWVDNSNDEDGFKVERSPIGVESWDSSWAVGANVTSFTDVRLPEGSTFRYRVYAFLQNETSPITDPVEGSTLPAGPTQLAAAKDTPTSILLNWTDNSTAETGFVIERKVIGGEYQVAGTVASNVTTFLNTGLTENTMYVFRVRAAKGNVNSAWSNEVSLQTGLLTPDQPADFLVRAGAEYPTGAYLSWTDRSDNEDGFVVEVSDQRNTGYTVADTVVPNSSNVVVSGFPAESIRYFRMYAFNGFGKSPNTGVVGATIYGIPPAPSNLVATSTNATPFSAVISWSDNSASEDGFVLEYSANGVDGWATVDTLAANATGARMNNLTPELSASFRLYAYNLAGRSGYTNTSSAVVTGPPNPPSNLTGAAPTYYEVELHWQDNSSAETSFAIDRKEHSSLNFRYCGVAPANATAFNDTTVSADKIYDYQVRALNDIGTSAASNVVTVTTPMRPPTAPIDLSHTEIDVDKIQLVWTDRSNNEDGFFIDRMGPDDNDWVFHDVNAANNSYYLDTLCVPETWYRYRVRSHNQAGYSSWSNVDSAQTLGLSVYFEGFEGMALDQPPAGWTMNEGGTSSSRVTSTRPYEGDKSYEVQDADEGDANFSLSYTAHPNLVKGTMVGWLYIAPGGFFRFAGGTSTLNYNCVVDFMPNDSFRVLDGGNPVDCGTYPTNQWFKVEIVFDTENALWHVEFNDEQVTADVATWTPGTTEGYIVTLAPSDFAIDHVWMDNIELLRYYNPPQRVRQFLGRRNGAKFESSKIDASSLEGIPLHR